MTNEIKEILDELESMFEISELEEQVNNINKIKNYITNLQQRIDKTLKFIKKQKHWWEEWHYDMCGVDDDIEEIENILRGDE